jgi:hypothetical protein
LLELKTTLSVLLRKLDTALGGCTCVVGVEGREIGCCFGSSGGVKGDSGWGDWMLVMIFGRNGGVAECRATGDAGFFDVVAGKGKDKDEDIGGAGVGGALEVGGIGLGLGFADRSKGCSKGVIEGD